MTLGKVDNMNKPEIKIRELLAKENAKWPINLIKVPKEKWGNIQCNLKTLLEVWRSRKYLVQVFTENNNVIRLSINITQMEKGRWIQGISWDCLQAIKRDIGYKDSYAIEIFPRDKDIVNVANIRHLWILPEPLDIGWTSNERP